jgi:biotin carboxyl carrier protein
MTQDAEFSLRDAIEVLRLLDSDPSPTLDIRHHGFRLQCVRGTASSPAGVKQAGGPGTKESRRHTIVRAPAAGRFHGDAAVFAGRATSIKAGSIVGRIDAGGRTAAVTVSVGGKVLHVCVAPDGFVEYGQTLLVIDAA